MTDLNELLERVKRATGPTLDLDGRTWCAANGFEFVMWDGAGCVYRNPNAPAWDRGIQHAPASTVKPFSASIDHALLLAERLLPGCWYVMAKGRMRDEEPLYACELLEGAERQIAINEGHTQPLAILAALLSALISKESQS